MATVCDTYLSYEERTLILVILRKWPQKVKYHIAALVHGNFLEFCLYKSKVKELQDFTKFLCFKSGNKLQIFGTQRILVVFVI